MEKAGGYLESASMVEPGKLQNPLNRLEGAKGTGSNYHLRSRESLISCPSGRHRDPHRENRHRLRHQGPARYIQFHLPHFASLCDRHPVRLRGRRKSVGLSGGFHLVYLHVPRGWCVAVDKYPVRRASKSVLDAAPQDRNHTGRDALAVVCGPWQTAHYGLAGREYLETLRSESRAPMGSCSAICIRVLLPALTSCGFKVVIARTICAGRLEVALRARPPESTGSGLIQVA